MPRRLWNLYWESWEWLLLVCAADACTAAADRVYSNRVRNKSVNKDYDEKHETVDKSAVWLLQYSKFILTFKKPFEDDLSFMTWHVILVAVAIKTWTCCGQKGIDKVTNNNV